MTAASMAENVSPKLLEVMERAKRDPQMRFFSLAHLIDEAALKRSYDRIRKDAAVGVDGVTKDRYGQELESHLADLHGRMKAGRYRHQPLRRVHIPKDKGTTRPLGISCVEDKVVQGAIREVLEAVYEPVFHDDSYGSRPKRSAHQALRALDRALMRGEVHWVLEADIVSFFDSIVRKMLMEMLQERVADSSMLRLVGKCLHVGILDGSEYSEPDEGTAQGSSLSPLLGNVYLHHVLDRWFERDVLPRLRGKARLIRYVDDFVIGFEREDDARRVREALGQRLERFGLRLHPDKTRLLPFGRPDKDDSSGKGPATFDLLGFTLYWRRTRTGTWVPAFKTRKARLRRAIEAATAWCRGHRLLTVKEQHATLTRRIEGHFNYFGVNGNLRSLRVLVAEVERAWHKWLSRRGQRKPTSWARFKDVLRVFPLPTPTIRIQLWKLS
jgi:group II intron reverse transcriptase/maturase